MAETTDVSPDDANGSTAVQIEPSSNEDVLFLDDMDSFWDEVNTGLHVSRVVTSAVIKGILSDVEQDVAQKICVKDAEISLLNQKLQQLENSSLSLPEGRDKRYDEFYYLREQLDSISRSLLNSEWGLSGSQHNSESSEDMGKQRGKEQSSRDGIAKENGSKASQEVFSDPAVLKHMDKDEVIAHFNKAMNQMKIQHDSTVQQQTEEIFELKRKLLRNEGPNPWHLRNNKELEQMRKKISEVVSKLDVLLLENKRTIVRIKSDAFPCPQDKSNVLDSDTRQLQGGASVESDHAKHIISLEADIEDANIAAFIREEIEKIVVKEFVSERKIGLHGYEPELNMKQEVCSIIQKEAIAEAVSNINSSLLKNNEEEGCAEAESLLKQNIDKLNLVVDSFIEVVRQKEEFVSQIGLEAMEARVDSLCHELDFLRDKVGKQDLYISEKSREFDIIMGRLEHAQQHVQHNDVTLSELNDRFRTISDSLKELEKQNQVLHTVIEEKEKTLTSAVSKDNEFKECMKHAVESMRDFEKFVTDQQTIVANKVKHSESRFCLLKEQCMHLAKEGNLLRKKALRYKEISETRGSNLQKAELEVDLLGDEVEALTDFLAKIYIALDHYSPVLQHYTGVMETLNMIKKRISMAK
ncbi:WPP domain-associated protein-like [Phragmites australis]|uniref:WPP domain-associated protein-like n=1 Tax=Phragmites australis TaxID=29695 RepID=UPI002D795743|nr:WPP domain-associated protein-like [Phragmites australis]XP_062196192.1 WPP domain-associated protein-like [Phragmites australis]XP_062196193.1 WPP domain-associated protein-like [Phragmites australis]